MELSSKICMICGEFWSECELLSLKSGEMLLRRPDSNRVIHLKEEQFREVSPSIVGWGKTYQAAIESEYRDAVWNSWCGSGAYANAPLAKSSISLESIDLNAAIKRINQKYGVECRESRRKHDIRLAGSAEPSLRYAREARDRPRRVVAPRPFK